MCVRSAGGMWVGGNLEAGPEREVDPVQIAVQTGDAAVAHDEAMLIVDADHEQQPDHVMRLLMHSGKFSGHP